MGGTALSKRCWLMTVRLPATEAQAGVWLAQQLNPDDTSFNAGQCVEIRGPLDSEALARAQDILIAETEALRSTFTMHEDGLWQAVLESVDEVPAFIDLSSDPDPAGAAERRMAEQLAEPFDLSTGPLFRLTVLRLSPEQHFWCQTGHHVALDGAAIAILATRLAVVYTALISGAPIPDRAPGSLSDVLRAEREYQASAWLDDDRRYWEAQLADLPRRAVPGTEPDRLSFLREGAAVSGPTRRRLVTVADTLGATWAELVVAAAYVLEHRRTGARDIVLSLPVSARTTPLLRRVPTMLANVVPLRLRVEPDLEFGDLLDRTAEALAGARRHQRYRRERLLRNVPGLAGRCPLFGPDVNVQSFRYATTFGECPAISRNLSTGPVEDISVQVYARSEAGSEAHGVWVDIDGNSERYDRAAVAERLHQFTEVLELAADPDPGWVVGRDLPVVSGHHLTTAAPM